MDRQSDRQTDRHSDHLMPPMYLSGWLHKKGIEFIKPTDEPIERGLCKTGPPLPLHICRSQEKEMHSFRCILKEP